MPHSQILFVSLLGVLALAGPALGAAERFRRCDCTYSEWSEWSVVPNSVVSVSTTACESGEAYSETRSRTVAGGGCDPQMETRQICLPDPLDRLILALGLGRVNGNSNPGTPGPRLQKRQSLCPAVDLEDDPWVCSRFHEKRRKRSLREEYLQHFRSTEKTEDDVPKQSSSTPLPFDWNLHHSRFRRQIQNCYPNGIQHVLFLLDTSGSIGRSNWDRIKIVISNLTALFCRPIRVAVMTFNHHFKLEFCFNCFDSSFTGRAAARHAIRNIPYRGGWTHTAGATLCACEELLHPDCGLHPYANCIDVVYIIGGQSNDGTREVCDEVRCLHNHNVYERINTHAIGIGNVDGAELQCIHDLPVRFISITAFEDAIRVIITISTDSWYECAPWIG